MSDKLQVLLFILAFQFILWLFAGATAAHILLIISCGDKVAMVEPG